ncbi:MAG: hypothetical protein DMF95_21020 [Acidobacteria bacterium]|nr:MAG: hypothetical protein DMF95_21020 [Acidobacteriota bacterium]
MPIILAIEPDRRQAAHLTGVVRQKVAAELILAETTEGALDAIGNRVPDMVLVPALLSPQDDAALAAALRVIAAAANVRTLTIPVLANRPKFTKPGGMLAKWRRGRAESPAPDGCEPSVFAEQINAYLREAAAERAELESELDKTAATGTVPIGAARQIETPTTAMELATPGPIPFAEADAFAKPEPVVRAKPELVVLSRQEPVVLAIPAPMESPVVEPLEVWAAEPIEPPAPIAPIEAWAAEPIEPTAPIEPIKVWAAEPIEPPAPIEPIEQLAAATPVEDQVAAPVEDQVVALVEDELPAASGPASEAIADGQLDIDLSEELDGLSEESRDEEIFAGEPVGVYTISSAVEEPAMEAFDLLPAILEPAPIAPDTAASVADASLEECGLPIADCGVGSAASVVEEHVVEELVVEAPVVFAPTVFAPAVEESVIEAHVVEADVIGARDEEPVVFASAVFAPAVEASVVEAPVEEVVVFAPAFEESVIEAHVVEAPVVEAPIVEELVVGEYPVEAHVVEDMPAEEAETPRSDVGPWVPMYLTPGRMWPPLEGVLAEAATSLDEFQAHPEEDPIAAFVQAEIAQPEARPVPRPEPMPRPEPQPEARPLAASPKPDHPEWHELIASLRQDIQRRRGEPASMSAPPIAARPADSGDSDENRRAKKQKPFGKKSKPVQDEWGFFDPEQCGFSALLAKLEEITDPPEESGAGRPS